MPAQLLFRDAQGGDAAVDIPEATPIFIGRAADCAVRTDDAMVSRKNCKMAFVGGKFFVEDLGSANGTYVTSGGVERRITKQQLTHGDIVRCGSLQVRFVEVAARPHAGDTPPQNLTPQSLGGPTSPTTPSNLGSPTVPANQFGHMGQPGQMGQMGQMGGVNVVGPTGQPMVMTVGQQYVDPAAAAAAQAELGAAREAAEKAQKALADAQAELEQLRQRSELNDNELRRVKVEATQAREELTKLRRDADADKIELATVTRVFEETRRELAKAKEEVNNSRRQLDEQKDSFSAKERELDRTRDELKNQKQTTEQLRGKLSELQKTKEDGWREVNSYVSQIGQLREVLQEQERILEERRVGLIALESAAKELRAEKEKLLTEFVQVKNERDDLRDKINRMQANIEAFEEEQRRSARGGGASEDVSRLQAEVRDLKVELRKADGEKQRAVESLARVESERNKLADEKAQLEVERSNLAEEKKAAEVLKQKADVARKKLEDQLAVASKQAAGAGSAEAAELEARVDKAESRARDLERELEKLRAQLQTAQRAAASAPASAAGGDTDALRTRAREVYEGINEALSELRTTILTAKGLFGEVAATVKDEDARAAIVEAITSSMDRAEDAKGLLRTLKELT